MNKSADCWLPMFNAKKCKVIQYGKCSPHSQYALKALNGSTLITEGVQNECDSGITFDSALSLNEHIAHTVNKSNYVISLIKQSFQHMDNKVFLQLHKTLVRCIGENGSVT